MKHNIDSKVKLNNGITMPMIGFGTWPLRGKKAYEATLTALNNNYRSIDTAEYYCNEKEIGESIEDSKIPRKEIFVTTKLWPRNPGYESTLKAFEKSLKNLRLDYIDLYLIHWPDSVHNNEIWRAFEKIYYEGQVKAIGISNYQIAHITSLLKKAKIPPVINQIKFNPYLYQEKKDLIDFCLENVICVEAYSPLTQGNKLNDVKLISIASKYNKTPAQLLLRYCIEKNIVTIPKSSNSQRIKENIDIFDFSLKKEDITLLESF